MRIYINLAAGAFIGLFSAIPAFSQNIQTGAITARAQDTSGAVIPGVSVTIASPSMIGGSRSEISDEQGIARFELLAAGTYRVSFGLPGFRTMNIEGVDVTAGITRTIDGKLEVASTAEEVTVTSQAPTIDLEAATVGVNFSQKLIEDLPWSRSIMALSQMIPGVFGTAYDVGNSQFGGGSAAIAGRNGGRNGGNVVSYDGLIWCQTYADYGSFEEMNVITASKGADQMASGVVVNMVVKSGGNTFHGNFSGQYENGSMQSTNVTPALVQAGLPTGSNKFTHFRDVFGDIGGPVLKDKVWFYFGYNDGYNGTFIPGFNATMGGAASEFYTVLRNPTAKLTYQITPKQKIESYWGLGFKWQPYRGGSALTPQDATQDQDSWSTQGPTLKWTDIIDSKTTASVQISRGGYWWPSYAYSTPQGAGPTLGVVGGPSQLLPAVNYLGINNVGVRVTDTTSGATDGGFASSYQRPIRWQYNADISRVTTIAGKANELKGGYFGWWDKSYTISFGYPYEEQYRYKSLQSETCPNNIICSNYFQHPNSVIVYDYPGSNSAGGLYKGFYVNDKLTMSRRLTFNLGLRFDHASSFLPAQGNDGSGIYAVKNTIPYSTSVTNPDGSVAVFPTYNLLSPRLSFAYDLTGTGRLALKGSYGRYVGMTSSPNSQPGPGANSSGVNPISAKSCTFNNWNGVIPYVPNFGTQNFLGSSTNVNLSGACSGGATTAVHNFDPSLKSSYLNEFTAGLDIGLNRNYSVRMNMSRKFDIGGSKTLNVLTPFSAYTDLRCAADPITGVNNVCTYSIPVTNPNRTAVNQLFTNYDLSTHEGQAMYTAFDISFNKQYANNWSFLSSYAIDLGHPNTSNPLTPDNMLYNSQSDLGTWSQSIKMNGIYALPGIPLFAGKSFKGLQWSSTFTAQSGDWYGRTATVTNALGSAVSQTVQGHYGRYPWIKDWDQRISKKFKIGDRQILEVKWDLYNTTNINTITGWQSTNSNSSTFLLPSTIFTPRIYQWEATYKF